MIVQNSAFMARLRQRTLTEPQPSTPTGEDLLDLYLTLPQKEREKRFSDTAHAAKMIGLNQRTVQLWIEFGLVRAVPVGRKYQIDLDSLREYLKDRVKLQE